MTLILVTGATVKPVSLQEAKAHLRVDSDVDDPQIERIIADVTAELDGAYGWLGRCLVQQTWEYQTCGWPSCGEIEIPLPPLVSITSVKYLDSTETEQTLASNQYTVIAGGWGPSKVRPAYGVTWPAVACRRPDAVRVRFVAGYAEEDNGGLIVTDLSAWEGVRGPMLEKIAARYDNRTGTDEAEADSRLFKYRTSWFV